LVLCWQGERVHDSGKTTRFETRERVEREEKQEKRRSRRRGEAGDMKAITPLHSMETVKVNDAIGGGRGGKVKLGRLGE